MKKKFLLLSTLVTFCFNQIQAQDSVFISNYKIWNQQIESGEKKIKNDRDSIFQLYQALLFRQCWGKLVNELPKKLGTSIFLDWKTHPLYYKHSFIRTTELFAEEKNVRANLINMRIDNPDVADSIYLDTLNHSKYLNQEYIAYLYDEKKEHFSNLKRVVILSEPLDKWSSVWIKSIIASKKLNGVTGNDLNSYFTDIIYLPVDVYEKSENDFINKKYILKILLPRDFLSKDNLNGNDITLVEIGTSKISKENF